MDDDQLISLIEDYAEEHPNWDDSFIVSIREALEEYDDLTGGQRDACENIVRRYRLDD